MLDNTKGTDRSFGCPVGNLTLEMLNFSLNDSVF